MREALPSDTFSFPQNFVSSPDALWITLTSFLATKREQMRGRMSLNEIPSIIFHFIWFPIIPFHKLPIYLPSFYDVHVF